MNAEVGLVRDIKAGRFCWQEKPSRRVIREACDATHNVASALSTYDALTEIASDSGSETFTTTHAWISAKSGNAPRTIQGHLKLFQQLHLVAVQTPTLRAPSTYTLLLCNSCATTGTECGTLRNGPIIRPLPTSEEDRIHTDLTKEKITHAKGAPRRGSVKAPTFWRDLAVGLVPRMPWDHSVSFSGQTPAIRNEIIKRAKNRPGGMYAQQRH